MTSPLIIETNVEKILEDHLWPEVFLLETEICKLQFRIDELKNRQAKLVKIAAAAEIPEPEQS